MQMDIANGWSLRGREGGGVHEAIHFLVAALNPRGAQRTLFDASLHPPIGLIGLSYCFALNNRKSYGTVPRRPGLSTESLSRLLTTLYAAPLGSDQWAAFLVSLMRLLNLPAVAIHHHDFGSQEYQFNVSAGMDPGALSLYAQHFGKLDPYWPEFLKTPEDKIAFGESLCPTRKLLRTEFYGDFLSKHEDILGVYTAAAMVKQPSRWLAITAYRRLADPHPGPGTADVVRLVMPHVRSALQLQQQVVDLTSARRSLESGIELAGLAVLILDKTGVCIFASQKADRLLSVGNGLSMQNGHLRAERHSESVALWALISGALITSAGNLVRPNSGVMISRRKQPPLRISAFAISGAARHFTISTHRQPALILFIRERDDDSRSLPSALAMVYGVSKAESRLSLLLYDGCSLAEAATTIGVSIETVRAQLKSIFRKTGVRRQSALIRLLTEIAKTY
jgi:DNA-binding CsgD family transcriptional regulator